MKKLWRIVACVLVTVLLSVSLCGCDALDEARANHAFVTESGSILLGEAEYLLLPYCEELQPVFTYERTIFATAPDVPVLLSAFWGTSYDISRDEVILAASWDTSSVYCRKDRYEEILRRINEGFTPVGYGYAYYDYEKEEDKYYTLSSEEMAAVDAVYAEEGQPLPEMADMYFEYEVFLEQHSDDLLFRRDLATLGVIEGTYYLVEWTEEDTLLHKVPANYIKTFEHILAPLVEAESYWEEEFMYEYDFEDFEDEEALLDM